MQAGLLMEAAQSQQRLADTSLKKLKTQIGELAELVREEVRQTMVQELQGIASDSRHAADALRRLRRAAGVNLLIWSVAITSVCVLLALAIVWWVLPSRAEIAALRARRDDLALAVASLERQAGKVAWRRCGAEQRLCVQIDRRAPAFGDAADFLIVKGY